MSFCCRLAAQDSSTEDRAHGLLPNQASSILLKLHVRVSHPYGTRKADIMSTRGVAGTATAAASAAASNQQPQSCQQQIKGQSVMYGQRPTSKAAYLDQAGIAAVTEGGQIVKINTYFSPNGCLTGVKPVYADASGISQLIGVQQGMKERSMVLPNSETINRIDIRYDLRCAEPLIQAVDVRRLKRSADRLSVNKQ